MHSKSSITTLLLAVLLQTASCQDKFDIPFAIVNNELYDLSTYSFNISLGTPPQSVPVSIELDRRDVRIDNNTSSLGENSPNKYYNPALSTSAQDDIPNLILTSPASSTNSGSLVNSTYVYRKDKYAINNANLTRPLSFIYSQSFTSVSAAGKVRTFPALRQYHEIGFGLPGASVEGKQNAISRGVIEDFIESGLIKSRSYSLWLNQDKKTGHLLLGGGDEKAFKAPLVSLDTTVFNQKAALYNYSLLTVEASVGSVSTGKDAIKLDFPLGKTFLSTVDTILLPQTITTRIWDLLGVDYKTYDNNAARDPSTPLNLATADAVVPCAYLTNTSTVSFSLTGFSTPITVPISELTFKSPYNTSDLQGNDIADKLCHLNVKPSQDGSASVLGLPVTKKLYLMVDLDGKKVSVAELAGDVGAITGTGGNATEGTKDKSAAGRVSGGMSQLMGVLMLIGGAVLL